MTEYDLLCYIRAKNALKRAEEAFAESSVIYHPPTSTVSFMPKEHSDDVEKVTSRINEKDARGSMIRKANESIDRAFSILEKVSAVLVREEDKNFLWNFYFHGLTYQQIEDKYGRSKSSLYRDRKSVLSQIKNLSI